MVAGVFMALFLGFIIGNSQSLSYKSKAEANKLLSSPPQPSIDSLTNSITGKITNIQDLGSGKRAVEVTGISFRDLLGFLPATEPKTNTSVKPFTEALPSMAPPTEKKYPLIVDSSTEIVLLTMLPQSMSLSEFMSKPQPSQIPPKPLTTTDLQTNMSVTVYFGTDGVTAKKITVTPPLSPVAQSKDQELKNPSPLPTIESVNPIDTLVQKELTKFKINILGTSIKTNNDTIPQSLAGLPWALIQEACIKGGYDLQSNTGQNVSTATYAINEYMGTPPVQMQATVYLLNNKIICVTKFPDSSKLPMTGGPYAINVKINNVPTANEREEAKKLPKEKCGCWDGVNNICLPISSCQ